MRLILIKCHNVQILLAIIFASLLPIQAQEKPLLIKPRPQEANQQTSGTKDYAAAFQKLLDLGFPDAKGAKYIKLEIPAANDQQERDYYQRYTIKRKGNAWLLPQEDPKSKTYTAIRNGFQTTEITLKAKRNLLARLLSDSDDTPQDGINKASWTEVDPAAEVEKILKQLENNGQLRRMFDGDSWSYDKSAISSLGDLLMTSCHIYRSGDTVSGNKLAHFILSEAPYPFRLIDHIIGQLAADEYSAHLNALYANQDWKLYLKEIRLLSAKYPRGWDDQPGLKILIPKVVSHLRLGSAKLSPFKGQPLDPEIAAALDQLLSTDPTNPGQPINATSPLCWAIRIQDDQDQNPRHHRTSPPPEWVTKITARGLSAFPTLIAAAADQTFIPAPFYTQSSNEYQETFYSGQQDDNTEETSYQDMNRPCTRGEIVRSILTQTLPGNDGEWSSLSPEDFQLSAYDWWIENKGTPTAKLALVYLREGTENQKAIAVQTLLTTKDESSYAIIEDFILSAESLTQNTELVRSYLKERKAKGKKFYETYILKLREEMDRSYGGSGMADQIDEYFKQITAGLSILVNDIPPEKIMAQMANGETPVKEGLQILEVAIGQGAFLEKLGPLLTFATELEDQADRLATLSSLQDWITTNAIFSPDQEEFTNYQVKVRELGTTHQETWQTFLDRKSPLTIEQKAIAQYGSPSSEAQYAAMVMNSIHFPETLNQFDAMNTVSSSLEAWSLLVDRMEEFTTTGKAPPFPSASLVPEKRQQEILSKIKDLPTLDIITYRTSLSISERIAASDLIMALPDQPENIAALAQICQEIDWSRSSGLAATTHDQLEGALVGKRISAEMVEEALKILSTQTEGIMLYFQSTNGNLAGPRIMVWPTSLSSGWLDQYIQADLGKLTSEKSKRLEALITFGLNREDDTTPTAVRFLAPLDEATENAAFAELLTESLTLFDLADEENQPSGESGFIIATETFENRAAIASANEEQDGQ